VSIVVLGGTPRLRQLRNVVFLASQPHQPIIIKEYGQWVHYTRHEDVYTEVELMPIDQRRVLYVFLHNVGIILFHGGGRLHHIDGDGLTLLSEILLLLLGGGGGARRGVPEEEGLSILHDVRILHRRVIVLLLL